MVAYDWQDRLMLVLPISSYYATQIPRLIGTMTLAFDDYDDDEPFSWEVFVISLLLASMTFVFMARNMLKNLTDVLSRD